MIFIKSVVMLLVLLIGIVLSEQDTCWQYGNCNPGPYCNDWNNYFKVKDGKCFDCCDDVGYISKDKVCDGYRDCDTGLDEHPSYCSDKNLRSQTDSCFAPKEYCSGDKECCSEICRNGSCWDEMCAQNY